ncbi:hypothetical protein DJ021_06630 [Phenylobacterium hankyongense]|uniref:Uncharacterized protein n=1 Tax=Phenylobacterium hankyongense TaxID=1813876 RepID=A0A328AWP1_9CAUL|nr:hypothetical protein [Phenylobacterium hankyongense]RAK59500.1 hypothetical protein DJ021_06630 [Phenylobacterium hankyongense]
MSKGSYRGGSTLTGWNANGYVSGSAGRKLRGKAATARTAQTSSESATEDEIVRRRHGLTPRKPKPKPETQAEKNARQRRITRVSAPVVVKVKRRRQLKKPAPRPLVSAPRSKTP